MHYGQNRTRDPGKKSWHKSPIKRRKVSKMAFLTKKSKIFIKAKFTVFKSYLLGLDRFRILCIWRWWPYINHKISLLYDLYFDHFFGFSLPFYDAISYGSTFKIPCFNLDWILISSGMFKAVQKYYMNWVCLSND